MSRHLLSDVQMQRFIRDGYISMRTTHERDFHTSLYDKIKTVLAEEGNPGNNVLPRIPEIQRVFDDPAVSGALVSLLGPGYLMHPHRYCHLNRPGSSGQRWHKDDYIFDQNVRRHRFRWLMAFYYPQDVTEDMGPTGILPQSQYRNEISSDDPDRSTEPALSICGPAGTVTLVNFDIWHRACQNSSERNRCMLKFQFTRMAEPGAGPDTPTWNSRNQGWTLPGADPLPRVSRSVWDWLSGSAGDKTESTALDASWMDALSSDEETERLDATYALGHGCTTQVSKLLDHLKTHGEADAGKMIVKNSTNPQGGNPSDVAVVHGLSAAGKSAVPWLIDALDDSDWWVRSACAEALGNMGSTASSARDALARKLEDGNVWVRRNSVEALGTIGGLYQAKVSGFISAMRDSDERVRRNTVFSLSRQKLSHPDLVQPLRAALGDDSRYVRYYAAVALRNNELPEAQEALWRDVIASRWCPVTTGKSPY